MKAILDSVLGIVISKKLTVFLISTFFVWKEIITSDQWIQIAMVYIGCQSALDIFLAIKNKKTR